jgi:hypothetical protein
MTERRVDTGETRHDAGHQGGIQDGPDAAALRAAKLAARRRFLTGGLVAAPLVVTLANRPALAASNRLCNGTVTASAAASFNGGTAPACAGYSAGTWYNKSTAEWGTAGFDKNTVTFNQAFGFGVGTKLTDLLVGGGTLAQKEAAAGILNAGTFGLSYGWDVGDFRIFVADEISINAADLAVRLNFLNSRST